MNKTTEKRLEALMLRLEEISKELSDVNFDGVSAQIEEIEKKRIGLEL